LDNQNLNQPDANHVPPPPAAPPSVPGVVEPPPAATAGEWLRQNGRVLFILALGVGWLYAKYGLDGLWTILLAAVGLGFVIFIHELGHFLVAKWCDVHVETFSIGFGPPMPGCCYKWGETTYMLALLPLGGYVKMVGQVDGDEKDDPDNDDDPRSYKNKKVWQRMAIISAGVIMNVILGAACFIFVFMAHGMERPPAVIGQVDSGSPVWKKGGQSGDVIREIGDAKAMPGAPLYFDDLMTQVVLSKENQPLPFEYGPPGPGGPIYTTTIEPRDDKEGGRPVIGVRPPLCLKLPPERVKKHLKMPAFRHSAAAEAKPAFEFGDEIVGSTDPEADGKVTPLPLDPGNPEQRDYFAFRKRCQLLRGQEMIVRVKRANGEEQDLKVPPSYHHSLGLRMKIGRIVALRDDGPRPGQKCPARVAGVQYRGQKEGDKKLEGDELDAVEVEDDAGKPIRWVRSEPKTGERQLDPVRLPYELATWAAERKKGPRLVTLTVLRNVDHRSKLPTKLTPCEWDDSFRFDDEVPLNPQSSIAIPGLGLCYEVETTVEAVAPGSPATKGKKIVNNKVTDEPEELKKDDVIKGICFWSAGKKDEPPDMEMKSKMFFMKEPNWRPLERGNWAYYHEVFQHDTDMKRLSVQIERGSETIFAVIEAEPAKDWPMTDRGVRFMRDLRMQKATSLGQALEMGFGKTAGFITQIYQQIRALTTGRLSAKNLGGPIQIFDVAHGAADTSIFTLIFFLGLISVNLAVVNFLPIPVLDGGHMVFLIYEWLRGKPASEQVRIVATYVGLFLIASLMLFVIVMDVKRYFW